MSYLSPTVCAHCGHQHDRVSGIAEKGVKQEPPQEGDVTICIRCGQWNIFDDGSDGGLRKPTAAEARHIDKSKMARQVSKAWRQTNRRRGF
jgi:hypothetical protein